MPGTKPFDEQYEKYEKWFSKNRSVYQSEYSTKGVLSLLSECGFKEPEVIQTVFGELEEIRSVQDYRVGCGEGSFVVIRAKKGL